MLSRQRGPDHKFWSQVNKLCQKKGDINNTTCSPCTCERSEHHEALCSIQGMNELELNRTQGLSKVLANAGGTITTAPLTVLEIPRGGEIYFAGLLMQPLTFFPWYALQGVVDHPCKRIE